jgi:hypothetical protein
MDTALESSAGALVIGLVEEEGDDDEREQATYASKWCDENGSAMHEASDEFASLALAPDANNISAADDGGIGGAHPNAASRTFHCQLKINSESPDTLRGAYSLSKGLLCAIEEAGALDFSNPGTQEGVKLSFTDDCFGPKFLEEMDGATATLDVTLENLEGGWDKSVKFTNLAISGEGSGPGEYYFAFKNSAEGLAIRSYEIDGENTNKTSGYTFTLGSNGDLRFERKQFTAASASTALVDDEDEEEESDDSDDEDAYGADFVRILVKGSMVTEADEDGAQTAKYESVEKFEGIYSMVYPHPDSDVPENTDSGTIYTIKGTSELGYETRHYACNNTGTGAQSEDEDTCDAEDPSSWFSISDWNKDRDERTCFPTDKDCDGVDALEFASGDQKVLMRADSLKDLEKSPVNWIKDMENPLSFDSITWDYIQE